MSGPVVLKVAEKVGPLGTTPVVKQSPDITEVIVDFSAWLGVGEAVSSLQSITILANPSTSYPSWQTDFPFVTPTAPAPADTNTLVVQGAAIITSGTQAQLFIGAGTAGLAYMLSFLAYVLPTGRIKEIDILVSINQPVNSAMPITGPVTQVTAVAATTALAAGTTGSVNISNGAGAPITITLPPLPILDQTLNLKDVLGNAETFNITIQGAAGATIDGATTFTFSQNFQASAFKWTGAQWSVL